MSSTDHLAGAERHRLMLGLFLPIQDGGWTPSTTPRSTDWRFDYNARLTRAAETLGFDLVFALAQWLGKGGHGGRMRYREQALDPLTVTAGLGAVTSRILLISTIHILYGWHPLQVAKFGATLDHITQGRWGINVVTGFKHSEAEMFGAALPEHDQRYAMADEFTEMMTRLWQEDAELTCSGQFWSTQNAFVTPRPARGRPTIVSAGSSQAGMAYAGKWADLMFVTSPGGSDVARACESLPAHIAAIRQAAASHGRTIKCLVNPHIICRETETAARDRLHSILEGEDREAVDNFVGGIAGGDTQGWRAHQRQGWAVGGNIQIVGSPEQVVDWMLKLYQAGCDGLQLCFFDFEEDLAFFGERVLPLMIEAGLRSP
jgi:FMNH2-dependent dimethyl sulfone monooxygenase